MNESAESVVLPRGVVTFLLTDVTDVTWEIIGAAVSVHEGIRLEEQGEGNSMMAVFERASNAVAAAVDAQLALDARSWGKPAAAVRMAIYTGEAELLDEWTYGAAAITRCARLWDQAQGGEVLVAAATAEIVADRLPPRTRLVPVGETVLCGLSRSERVHQLVHEALAAPVAYLGSGAGRLGSWPTRLVGRAGERTEVGTLLGQSRLVTIAGAGGAGKTRLAHAVAGDLTGRFTDVVWVELAQVTTGGDVATAVARACGALEIPGVGLVEVLVRFLGTNEILIVLDNCEHLLDPCATLVEELLHQTTRVRVLATSREPLSVSGEVTWRIPSLEIPPEKLIDPAAVGRCDAAALFVDRARAALPTFELDDVTTRDVTDICRRLDGLPLAIELAAARLLTGGSRSGLPRQQALGASVDWSYTLCAEEEQQLLRRLAVFVAPFSVEAAEVIAAEDGADRLAVFDLIARLVDKSLVQPAGDRYRLLETIRQFARERADERGELAELRDAHLRWFTNRSARWRLDRDILTEPTMREIGLESPDLLAALEWSLRAESGPAVALLWPLGRHWIAENSFAEVSRVAGLVLERFETGSAGWLTALAPMAEALMLARDPNWIGEARAMLAEGLTAPVAPEIRSQLDMFTTGSPVLFTAPYGPRWLESFVEVGRQEQNRAIECGAAAAVAYAYAAAGAVKENDPWCEWVDRQLPADAWARAGLSATRGYLALFRCEFDAAWRWVADHAHRRPPHFPSAAIAGLVGIYSGDQRFRGPALDAFEAMRSWGAYGSMSELLRAAGAIADGRLTDARTILEPVAGPVFLPNQSPLNERLRTHLALAAGDLDAAREQVEQLRSLLDPATSTHDATMPYTSASLRLGQADLAAHTGELREAEESAQLALGIVGADLPLVTVDALELLAVVLAQRNRTADAGRLVGATESFRGRTGYRFRLPMRHRQIEALRPELDAGELVAGAGLSLSEAVVLAQGTRGKRGRPSFGWEGLTPTELRVVDLVMTGASNAEIAEKLFVGVSTVKTHLVHVYGKLGLRTRTELAAAAARKEEIPKQTTPKETTQ